MCVAQAQYGSAPDIQGRNIANPVSLMLSAAVLLDWRVQAAALLNNAVGAVLNRPALRTRDVGGTENTDAFARSVSEAVAFIDGVEHSLTVGDATFIPAGAAHDFGNASGTRR